MFEVIKSHNWNELTPKRWKITKDSEERSYISDQYLLKIAVFRRKNIIILAITLYDDGLQIIKNYSKEIEPIAYDFLTSYPNFKITTILSFIN